MINDRINKIKEFLKEFHRGFDGYIELKAISKDGNVKREFFDLFSLDSPKFDKFISNNLDSNLYFSVNPRIKKSGKKEDVEFGNTLWLDIDFHEKDDIDKEFVLKEYENFKKKLEGLDFPYPNFVIFSGRGFQVFWKIDEVLPIDEIEKLENGVIEFFSKIYPNIDKNVKDITRVMRLPFTFNVKGDEPIETDLLEKISVFIPKNIIYQKIKVENDKKKEKISVESEVSEFKKNIPIKIRRKIINFFKHFWIPGHRHNLTMGIVNTFIRNKIREEHAKMIISKICDICNDEEKKQRINFLEYQYSQDPERLKWKGQITKEIIEILKEPEEKIKEKISLCGKKKEDFWLLFKWKRLLDSGEMIESDIEMIISSKLINWKLHKDHFKKFEFEYFTIQDLMDLPDEEIEFYVDPLVPKGKIIIIGGRPESFKSMFCFYMSLKIASGRRLFDFPVKRGKVLYIDMENDVMLVKKRLSYIFNVEKMESEEFFVWTSFNPREYEKIIKMVEDYDIIIFDSFRRFLMGNESDSDVVNKFYNQVLKPLKDSGKSVILIHHFRKKRGDVTDEDLMELFRGSTDIVASIDIALGMEKVTEEIDMENKESVFVVSVRRAKDRLGVGIPDFSFRVIKDDKQKKTFFVFEGFNRVLTLEERIKEMITRFLSDGEPHKRSEIVEYVKENIDEKISEKSIDRALARLTVHGTIEKLKRGSYMIPKNTLKKLLGDENEDEKRNI